MPAATLLRPAASPRLRSFQSPPATVTPPLVLVQSATSTNSTPFTTNAATFPRPVKAGNILWAAYGADKSDSIRSVPAGFQAIMSHASTSVSIWVGWKIADGTETTITLIHDVGTDAAGDSMWIGEFASADGGMWTILGKATAPTDESTPLAATSGTTAAIPASGGALAFFAWDTITTLADLTRYSNGFSQIQGALAAGGRGGLYVALRNGINMGATVETTQTRDNSDQCSACVVVFNKVPAPVVDPDWPRQVIHPGVQPSQRARFVPYPLGSTEVATNGATPVSLTDTGSGVEALTITAAGPLADVSTGADALTGTATLTVTDTGTGTDSLAVSTPVALADTGQGTDALTATATVPLADTGAGADSLTTTAAVPLTDTGTGADLLSVGTGSNPSLPDTATGTDALTSTATLTATDTGSGADTLTAAAAVALADTGHGTDTLTFTVGVALVDTGTGSDALTVPTRTISLADTIAALDALAVNTGLVVPVTVTGSDRATTTVTGTDRASATVTSGTAATGVTGSDRSSATVSGSDTATAHVTSG